ncbi:hypothetical protein CSC88_34880, partial [Klebsiella pneumoniae]
MQKLTFGLIGIPNCGKTTLFSQLPGPRQREAKWARVTVARKQCTLPATDHQVTMVDCAGTSPLTNIPSRTPLAGNYHRPTHPRSAPLSLPDVVM